MKNNFFSVFFVLYEKLFNFLLEKSKGMFLVLAMTVAILILYFVVIFAIQSYTLSSTLSQLLILSILITYIIGFIFLVSISKKIRVKLQNSPILITVLSVLVPVVLVSFQITTEISASSLNAESSIKQANDSNYKFSESFEQKSIEASKELIWRDLDYSDYEENLLYIARSYSKDCKTAYLRTQVIIKVFNRLNEQRRALELYALSIEPTKVSSLDYSYFEKQLLYVKRLKQELGFAINNCQDYKQKR